MRAFNEAEIEDEMVLQMMYRQLVHGEMNLIVERRLALMEQGSRAKIAIPDEDSDEETREAWAPRLLMQRFEDHLERDGQE